MKIAQINMIAYGSTGKIMLQIAETARKEGNEARTFSTVPYDKKEKNAKITSKNHYVFGSYNENRFHYYFGSLLGRNGCFSLHGTRQLIKQLNTFKPDIIHLHNLHKFCINLPMLFRYIKKSKIPVVWTLHDCWAFTGQCPYFTVAKCDKWKTGCEHCSQIGIYPKSRIDNSKRMYDLKKRWFAGVENMIIITPSQWLANLVKHSFLKDYPVKVVHNGIDLNVFKPTYSDFFRNQNIPDGKNIILGVSFGWSYRKGLDVFVELAKRLDREKYQIVLVGTNDKTDKQLPDNIISIHSTNNQQELAQIYTAADLFVNPTREEVLGMVNIEALACGTPVVTFKTGGSPETIDKTCGSVVECDDVDGLELEIKRICTDKPYSTNACLRRAKQFDMNDRFKEYVRLYEDSTYSTKRTI